MTAHRVLLAYEELLRGFQQSLSPVYGSVEETLESGFGYLATRFHFDQIGLLWWDEKSKCLHSKYAFNINTLMEAEDDVVVDDATSPLYPLIKDKKSIITSKMNPWIAYAPLLYRGHVIGAVRFERKRPLPQGRVMAGLPRIQPVDSVPQRSFPLLEDLSDILSVKLQEVLTYERQRKESRYFQAGVEVAHDVVETPRLVDMLSSVSLSLIKNIGVDRVRFYLVESTTQELKGALGMQMPKRVLSLEKEVYPLIPHSNSLVDAVMEGSATNQSPTSDGKVLTIPLQVGGHVLGCLAVDNLLSQQAFEEEQIQTLKALSVQIAMAIHNAQLFEDIEQQAVTDGLTKLYVYRYFQQRLKEEIDRAERYSYSVALVMMDVDSFKQINDTYGHPFGDKVLEFLSQHIRANIRRIDLAARYGGDEFVMLLPEITEREAWLMATRLLNAIKNSSLQTASGQHVQVSVSLGVAMFPSDAQQGKDLIEAADQALYASKKSNRGDITFYRSTQGNGSMEKSA